jgi:CD2 antigen cytoplasmic tail-binding protein 2
MSLKRTGGDPSAAPKRTRFAEPTSEAGPSKRGRSPSSASNDGVDDQFLEADITESSRNAKKRERAALRDQDGYGSDSSNDEESVVPSRRPDAKQDDDDDVDMFGDAEEEPKETDKGKGKAKEFMDLRDVEGQEDLERGEDRRLKRANAEDSDSEAEDEGTGLDGSMGVEITPFNMKKEFEEGRFTEGGETYVENEKDPHEQHDHWLDGTDKDEIKKARRAHRERERLEREREAREAEVASGVGSEEREHRLMRDAIELMERGETVLEALQRLGGEAEAKRRKEEGGKKKKSWAERQRERKAAMAIDTAYVDFNGSADPSDPEHGSPFGRLTAIVSGLQAIGQLDVYSLSREAIQRMLPREETAPAVAPARPPPDNRAFQYRFSLAYLRTLPEDQRPVEREVFGELSVRRR